MAAGRLVGEGVLNKIVLATTALMEVKSSMGVIVAAGWRAKSQPQTL